MSENLKFPEYTKIVYTLNTSNNTYQVSTKPHGFNKLPDEIQNVFEHGTEKYPAPNYRFGDEYLFKPKKRGFLIHHFSDDRNILTCYFFDKKETIPPQMKGVVFWNYKRQIIENEKLHD